MTIEQLEALAALMGAAYQQWCVAGHIRSAASDRFDGIAAAVGALTGKTSYDVSIAMKDAAPAGGHDGPVEPFVRAAAFALAELGLR